MCLRTHSAPALGRLRCACEPIRRPRTGACDVPADPLVACARLPAMCLRTDSAPTPRSSPLFGACARVPAAPFGAHARVHAMCLRTHSTPALGCLRCSCGPIRRHARVHNMCLRTHSAPALGRLRCACGLIWRPRPGACDVPADPLVRRRSFVCDVPEDPFGAHAQEFALIRRLRSGACVVPADPYGAHARVPSMCLRTH